MNGSFGAPLAGLLLTAGVAALPAAAHSAELPRECTTSGLEVLCVFAKPSAKPIRFAVPDGVSSIEAFVQGGAGGNGPPDTSFGGRGGTAIGVLLVSPGNVLDLRVGGRGGNATAFGGRPAAGGINGGGDAGTTGAGAGGGRTEIHARAGKVGQEVSANPLTTDPLIAAGGGGGAGAAPRSGGGNGGGSLGAHGLAGAANRAGAGATESTGGAGAGGADAGARGLGGTGAGAGGGAGYFGGGGAGRAETAGLRTVAVAGGGGGGSGFGLPGTVFGLAPGLADGIVHLRFKQLLMNVDVTRVCAPGGPVPTGWILHEGTDGADVMVGSGVNELFRGRMGDDRISGRGGDDILCGDAGTDVLRGGEGNDLLLGGRGKDRLVGGVGEDRGIDLDVGTTWVGIESRD